MNRPFTPGDRTYHVSDERLRAFGQLTPEQRLKWVEELAAFLRLAKAGNAGLAQTKDKVTTNISAC